MRYLVADAGEPVSYALCGNLMSKDEFVHPRRIIDTHVLILVKEGTLFITQSGIEYEVGANQYIYLIAGEEHFGHRSSIGKLSYLWCHFSIRSEINLLEAEINEYGEDCLTSECNRGYVMPEYGEISLTQRAPLLFNQLLDLSKQEQIYSAQMLDYALSLLIMEISQEFFEIRDRILQKIPSNIARIMEWIKANYYKPLTVNEIAEEFGYNPDYLSALFKKITNITLIQFINKTRVDIAKSLIVNYDISIKEAAFSCGFNDEKYFMKTFKKFEAMTPSQYKKAFTRKMIN